MAASSGATTSGSSGLPPSGGGGGRAGGLLDLGNLLGDLGDSSLTGGGPSASSTSTQQPQKQWNASGGWASSASAFGQPAGMASSAKPSGGSLLDLSDLLGGGPGGGDGASLSSIPDPHPRGAVTLDLHLNPQVG